MAIRSPKPYGFGRTTAKMATFWGTDCHVGLRPPRNDSPFSTRCCRRRRQLHSVCRCDAPAERRAAPAGACGEQPPEAALSERRRRSLRLRLFHCPVGEPSASPFLSLCPKTTAKNCQMRQLRRNRFHGIMLTYRRSMPTPQNRHNSLKQRRKFPSDSRCGSVETCRNSASVLLRCGENAREMVGAFRVVTQWQV